MAKLTAEEKLQRALERKEAKRLEKQRAFIERVEAAREITHSLMDAKQLSIFHERKEIFVSGDKSLLNNIEKSIFSQYFMWGKLSVAQINIILNKAEEQKKLKFEQVFFEEFDKNILNTFNLKFVSITEEFEDQPAFYGQASSSMVIRLINDANQHFKIKTNSKKIVSLFEGEKEGVWFRVSGYIKYISDNNKYVNLTSRGIKIEEIVK